MRCSDNMYLHVEEKRGWMRTHTRRVIHERDPDFERLSNELDGTVVRWLRVWLAEGSPEEGRLKRYVGCVGLCPGLPTHSEMRGVFRRLSDVVLAAGQPSRVWRQQLSQELRARLEPQAPRAVAPRHAPSDAPQAAAPTTRDAAALREGWCDAARRFVRARHIAAACLLAGLGLLLGCQPPQSTIKELSFQHEPPAVPELPQLVAPQRQRARATVRTDVEVQDWWRGDWRPLPKSEMAIVTSSGAADAAIAATASARLGMALQQQEYRLLDSELAHQGNKHPDVFITLAVSVNVIDRQQVTLSSTYDAADVRRYNQDYQGFIAAALRYLDRIDHEYIVRLKSVINTDSPTWRQRIAALIEGVERVRQDLRQQDQATVAVASANQPRVPQLVLPLEPYAAAEARGATAARNRAAASTAPTDGTAAYNPLADYNRDDLPVPPSALPGRLSQRPEYETRAFSVQVSQAEMALRFVDGSTGQVVGLAVFRCTDNTVGRAVERMVQACVERLHRP